MLRQILTFNQDESGDWVAGLECGHTRHVRHRPPFDNRPWVVSEEGRRAHIGFQLDCKKCEAQREADAVR